MLTCISLRWLSLLTISFIFYCFLIFLVFTSYIQEGCFRKENDRNLILQKWWTFFSYGKKYPTIFNRTFQRIGSMMNLWVWVFPFFIFLWLYARFYILFCYCPNYLYFILGVIQFIKYKCISDVIFPRKYWTFEPVDL